MGGIEQVIGAGVLVERFSARRAAEGGAYNAVNVCF